MDVIQVYFTFVLYILIYNGIMYNVDNAFLFIYS